MLTKKKIARKRFITYVIIIIVMFGGMFFMLYQNYRLTAKKPVIEYENIFNDPNLSGIDLIVGEEEFVQSKDKKNSINIDIFNDQKFQALKNNVIDQSGKIKIGKKNPFEAY